MINSKQWLALAVFAAGVLAVSSVQAGVASYPATMCVRLQTSNEPWYFQASLEANDGGTFVCPAAQLGGRLTGAVVYGRDMLVVSEVRCDARVRDSQGGGGLFTASLSSGVSFVGNFTFNLGGLPAPGSYPGGTKVIQCAMGAPTGLGGNILSSYTITEL
jgi:hypothetical protein